MDQLESADVPVPEKSGIKVVTQGITFFPTRYTLEEIDQILKRTPDGVRDQVHVIFDEFFSQHELKKQANFVPVGPAGSKEDDSF